MELKLKKITLLNRQIALADVVIINKEDLVTPETLTDLKTRIL